MAFLKIRISMSFWNDYNQLKILYPPDDPDESNLATPEFFVSGPRGLTFFPESDPFNPAYWAIEGGNNTADNEEFVFNVPHPVGAFDEIYMGFLYVYATIEVTVLESPNEAGPYAEIGYYNQYADNGFTIPLIPRGSAFWHRLIKSEQEPDGT